MQGTSVTSSNRAARSLSSAGDRTQTFVALDGLRGIAAIAVAARHAPYLWAAGAPTGFLRESYLAVDFFFILSGFVIAQAYERRLAGTLTWRGYMALRLERLYPAILGGLALGVVFTAWSIAH